MNAVWGMKGLLDIYYYYLLDILGVFFERAFFYNLLILFNTLLLLLPENPVTSVSLFLLFLIWYSIQIWIIYCPFKTLLVI